MKILSVETLRVRRACHRQVTDFAEMFGEFVVVTPALCEELHDKFEFGWAAEYLLSTPNFVEWWVAVSNALAALRLDFEARGVLFNLGSPEYEAYSKMKARLFGELYNKEQDDE